MVALLEAICRSFIQTLSPAEQEGGCLHKVDANQILTKSPLLCAFLSVTYVCRVRAANCGSEPSIGFLSKCW
jgi:hypothetical protein